MRHPTPLQIAYEADHFTGADVAALLSEAQLAAAHEALEAAGESDLVAASKKGSVSRTITAPVIRQSHLRTALETAQPSVPEGERQRLAAIYDQFQAARSGEATAVPSASGKGKRVTLA